jgi:tetratricopeptide (TPR) repeat protein
MRTTRFVLFIAATAAAGAANAQIGSMGAGSSSQMYQAAQQETPEHRAAEAYNRAARSIKRAEGARDANDRRKLYEKAREDLKKSLDVKPTFDALLAMGRVDLNLGDPRAALDFCTQAESYKSGDASTKACKDEAMRQSSAAAGPAPGASAAGTPPAAATPAAAVSAPAAPPATAPPPANPPPPGSTREPR